MPTSLDFSPLNDFFDHIYVISLEREVEKRERLTDLLTGLDYEFFSASDKKDFTIDGLVEAGIYDENKAIELHRHNKPMNTGQIGCSWSHRRVYEDMLEKGYRKALVLEDDVVPQKEGVEFLTQILTQLPGDWDLVYFDYHKNLHRNFGTFFKLLFYHLQRMLGRLKWSHKIIDNLYTRRYSEHLRFAGYHDYTSAYALSAKAASRLIELQTPLAFLADNLLAYACSNKLVKGFVTVPKVFVQASRCGDKKIRQNLVEKAF